MMGIKVSSGADFFLRLAQLVSRLGTVHWWSLGPSLAAVVVSSRPAGGMPTVPGAHGADRGDRRLGTLHLPAHGVAVLGSVPDRTADAVLSAAGLAPLGLRCCCAGRSPP